MGGDLRAPQGKSPTFLVAALKDPIGANLDRYQIIKGWLDRNGNLHEKSTTSHGRAIASRAATAASIGRQHRGRANATWTNTIGAPELITV